MNESLSGWTTIRQLLEYELWGTRSALNFVQSLTREEQHHDFGFGLRTPHHTMFHIINVMRTWSACVAPEIQKTEPLPYRAHGSLEDMERLLEEVGADWLRGAQASYELGVLNAERRLHQLFHLVTHGTHHRGQLLSMATLLGRKQPFEGGDFGGWSNQP
jgi:uncharacterized damage-inducible protein DinB